MRKVLTMVALVASFLFATNANAQIKLGVKGGLNASHLKLNDEMWTTDNKLGFFFGPMVKVTVPLVGLSFDVAALYDEKKAKMRYSDDVVGGDLSRQTTIKQQYIDIPINVRYGVGLGSLANVFVFAGPQWGINVGDKDFKWDASSSYSLRKATFSVNVGAGVTLFKHLQGTVNYNIECNKSGKMDTGRTNAKWVKGHNNTWQIALGYWF